MSKQKKGYVHLLLPTPELWTLVLKHRTQILYLADIATICCQLELKPGSIVLESGTGSGSLTTSLARAIAPTGQVYTFEFHEQRALDAAAEFEQNGLGKLITVEQRNIEELGFPENFHNKADAVFLDLPGPWKAIPSVAKCLRPDGVFCAFSPCIEQVQNSLEALNEHGFRAFQTVEILLREYEVFQDVAAGDEEMLSRMLADQENPELHQRVKEIRGGRGRGRGRGGAGETIPRDEQGREKIARIDANDKEEKGDGAMEIEGAEQLVGEASKEELEVGNEAATVVVEKNSSSVKERVMYARPTVQGRGHTGYLTFARKAA
jgi:tRNA (adenine57-N1/adenine58-N1)-methyltransferase